MTPQITNKTESWEAFATSNSRAFERRVKLAVNACEVALPLNRPKLTLASRSYSEKELDRHWALFRKERWVSENLIESHVRTGAQLSPPGTLRSFCNGRRALGLNYLIGGARLYPAFQFSRDLEEVYFEMAQILHTLPHDHTGWSQMVWFLTPNKALHGQTPKARFGASTQVLEAAEQEFGEQPSCWQ